MRVTKLSVQNFKGINATWALGPVTMITGANFAHKTSIPLAIRLGLAGYLPPPIGSRGIYDLAGNPEGQGFMSVVLELDNGRQVPWTWKKDAAGKVKVEGGVGVDIAMPELMLDPRLFFAKTAAEQIETIFAACQVDGFDIGKLKTSLSTISAPPLVECEKTIQEIHARIDANPLQNAPNPQAWIAALLDWLDVQRKAATDAQKQASGGFAAFRGDSIPADKSGPLEQKRKELEALLTKPDPAAELRVRRGVIVKRLAELKTAEEYADVEERAKQIVAKADFEDAEDAQEVIDEQGPIACSKRSHYGTAAAKAEMLKNEYAQLEGLEACPRCLNKRKGWKAEALTQINTQLAEAVRERDELQTAMDRADKAISQAKSWLAAKEQLDKASNLRMERSNLDHELLRIVEQINALTPARATAPIDIEHLREEVADLEEEQQAFAIYLKDRERKLGLEQRMLAHDCRAQVFKEAMQKVREETSILIDAAFGQVLQVARHFTDGLLNSALEFVDGELGRRVSDRDWHAGCVAPVGSWIPFKTFSGTEELLALAGFGVALTTGAAIKLVVLDELGRLDLQRKLDVTLRMLSLCESGVIDQAILIDVEPKPYQMLGKKITILSL